MTEEYDKCGSIDAHQCTPSKNETVDGLKIREPRDFVKTEIEKLARMQTEDFFKKYNEGLMNSMDLNNTFQKPSHPKNGDRWQREDGVMFVFRYGSWVK